MEHPDCDNGLTNAAALSALLRTLPDGGEVGLWVSGESMVPLYRHRETLVTLRREVTRPVCRGDAVLFLRSDGTPVLHRVVRVSDRGLRVGGDGQRWTELISPTQVLARVVKVKRRPDARTVMTDSLGYRLLVGLWSCGRWWHPCAARWLRRRYRRHERRDHRDPNRF